jgi:signal peptidase II
VYRRFVFVLVAVLIVVLDQLSKEWIRTNIPLGASLDEVLRFRIVHLSNTGSAFGMFPGQSIILTVVAFIGLVLVLVFYRRYGTASFLGGLAMGLIFGGAVGNLIDRIRLGAVTDFIYARLWGDVFWPAFNVADASVSIGVILFICFIIFGFKKPDANHS